MINNARIGIAIWLNLSIWFHTSAQVQISSDGHWIEYNGQKKLLIGESITQGWMELGANFNQTAYLDTLAARGINVLHVWSFIGIDDQTADGRIGYDSPEIWPWQKTGTTFDLTQHNQAYYNRLISLIQYAESKGIITIIQLHDGWTKTRFGGHPFNAANGGPLISNSQYVELHDYNSEMPVTYNAGWSRQQKHQYFLERFCEKMINETSGFPNVMFEIFNEGEWYNQTNLRAFQSHFLNFIKARTSYLTMVNDDHVGGANFRGEANCDIISYHQPNWSGSSSATASFNHYAPEFSGTPAKPFFFSEPVPSYEGVANTNDGMMRLMWGTVMAGVGFVVQNDASFGFDPNAAMAANMATNLIMLDLEGHCARFFNESGVSFWNMMPNGSYASTGIALVNPGNEYLIYSQGGSSFMVNLSDAVGETLNVRYYNPRTGVFQQPTISINGGAPSQIIYTPTNDDWVVHLAVASAIVVNKTETICEEDSLFTGGAFQTQAGTYTDTFLASNGSDSICITELTVLQNITVNKTEKICEGDSLFAGGSYQTQAGTYTDTFITANGCDSICITDIEVSEDFIIIRVDTIAESDSLFAGGMYQTQSGIYPDTFTASNGCDSIIITNLVVEPLTAIDELSKDLIEFLHMPSLFAVEIRIVNPSGIIQLKVFDMQGKEIWKQSTHSPGTTIRWNYKEMTNEIYLLHVVTGYGGLIRKIGVAK